MYVWVITILVTVVLCVGLICTRDILGKFIVWATITVLVFVAMWTVAPISISVDDTSITVRKRIGNKRILISNIETVRAITPSTIPIIRIGLRMFGSGGFAGYWGWYANSQIGTYFAYYGDRYECFLIKLKNGKKYILGCENSSEMIDRLKIQLNINSY